MNALLPRLVEFHRVARELAATLELLSGVPEEMRALHEEFTAARAALDGLEAEELEAKRRRAAAEGAVTDAQEKLRKFQQQVPRVRNQREYGALLAEIDGAKADLKRLEDETLAAIGAAESSGEALAERRRSFGELEARYAEGLAEWEARKPEVARRAEALAADAGRLRDELPKPIVAQYERIAARFRGEALSALRRSETTAGPGIWFCSTCNYQLRPQVAVEIRVRGSIVQCEGCKRFLFAEDAG